MAAKIVFGSAYEKSATIGASKIRALKSFARVKLSKSARSYSF